MDLFLLLILIPLVLTLVLHSLPNKAGDCSFFEGQSDWTLSRLVGFLTSWETQSALSIHTTLHFRACSLTFGQEWHGSLACPFFLSRGLLSYQWAEMTGTTRKLKIMTLHASVTWKAWTEWIHYRLSCGSQLLSMSRTSFFKSPEHLFCLFFGNRSFPARRGRVEYYGGWFRIGSSSRKTLWVRA